MDSCTWFIYHYACSTQLVSHEQISLFKLFPRCNCLLERLSIMDQSSQNKYNIYPTVARRIKKVISSKLRFINSFHFVRLISHKPYSNREESLSRWKIVNSNVIWMWRIVWLPRKELICVYFAEVRCVLIFALYDVDTLFIHSTWCYSKIEHRYWLSSCLNKVSTFYSMNRLFHGKG